jgi:type VI secretion system protein VasD
MVRASRAFAPSVSSAASAACRPSSRSRCSRFRFSRDASRPTVVKLTMRASPTINRDASGRPSPVAVRIYELKSPGAMDKADFFSLLSKEQDALGADLNTRHDYMLRPGDVMTLEQTLQPDTRYVAFVAAYREIERSRWRAVHPVTLHKQTALSLRVDDLDVTIGPP